MNTDPKQNVQSPPDIDSDRTQEAVTVLNEAPASDKVNLTSLHPGCVGMICSMQAVSADVNRLKAMGICIGRRVQVIQRGDPLIVCVLGTRLGISARLAHEIIVQTCGSDFSVSSDDRGAQ